MKIHLREILVLDLIEGYRDDGEVDELNGYDGKL